METFLKNLIPLVFGIFCFLNCGFGLDVRDVEEGSCHPIRNVPAVANTQPGLLDQFQYIPAGSKFQLYRHAHGHPHFGLVRDFKFFYEACLYKNVSFAAGRGSIFGFGDQRLVSLTLRGRNSADEPGVLVVSRERPGTGIPSGHSFTSKVTLTDNRNFAVLVHCWEGLGQKGWSVYSRNFVLDRETRRQIEKHVLEMGFSRDHVAFLEYDNCRYDEDYEDLDFEFVSNTKKHENKDKILSEKDKDKISSEKDKLTMFDDKSPKSGDKRLNNDKVSHKDGNKDDKDKDSDKKSDNLKDDKSTQSQSDIPSLKDSGRNYRNNRHSKDDDKKPARSSGRNKGNSATRYFDDDKDSSEEDFGKKKSSRDGFQNGRGWAS